MQYLKDRGFVHPHASEITPRSASTKAGARWCARWPLRSGVALAGWASRRAGAGATVGKLMALAGSRSAVAGALTMEKPTAYADATSYNNFYEFGTSKSDPAASAGRSSRGRGRWRSKARR